MSIPIQFSFSGEAAIGFFSSLGRETRYPNSRGLKKGFEAMGLVYLQAMRRRFQRNSTGGGTWPRLAPSTVARKGHGRILVDSGRLFRSLTRGTRDCVFAVDKQGLTIGTMVPYYRYHHNKRRVFVKPDPQTRAVMKAKIDAALQAAVAKEVRAVRSFSKVA
jgi:hypothetical protein